VRGGGRGERGNLPTTYLATQFSPNENWGGKGGEGGEKKRGERGGKRDAITSSAFLLPAINGEEEREEKGKGKEEKKRGGGGLIYPSHLPILHLAAG